MDCVCGGRYCQQVSDYSFDTSSLTKQITGRDIVYENLRQKCIYKNYREIYHKYIDQYLQKCFIDGKIVTSLNNCGVLIDKNLKINIISCIESSFTVPNNIFIDGDNLLMKEDRDIFTIKNLHSFPLIFINDVEY